MLNRIDLELSRIQITTRTLGGFSILVLLLAGFVIFSWVQLIEIGNGVRAAALAADADAAVGQISLQLDRLNNSARRFLRSRDMADVAAARAAASETSGALDAAIAKFRGSELLSQRSRIIKDRMAQHAQALEVAARATEGQSRIIDDFLADSMPISNIVPVLADAAFDSENKEFSRNATRLAMLFHLSKAATARYVMTLQPNDAESAQQELERFDEALAAQGPLGSERADRLFAAIKVKAPAFRSSTEEIFKAIASKAQAERDLSRATQSLDDVIGSLKQDFSLLRLQTTDAQVETIQSLRTLSAIIATSAIFVAILLAWLIGGSIARPILRMTETMQELASGDLRIAVPALGHHDEIGRMAKALEVFRENAQRLRESRSLLDTVIHSAPIMINVKGADGRYALLNKYQADLHRSSPEDAIGRSLAELTNQTEADDCQAFDRMVFGSGLPLLNYEQIYHDAAGREIQLVTSKVPLINEDRKVTHVVTVALDVTERKRAEEALKAAKEEAETARDEVTRLLENLAAAHQELALKNVELEKLSVIDRLTGLYNRRKLDQLVADECARAARSPSALAIIMVDIDEFKAVNDAFGHQAGDLVLSGIANIMRLSVRNVDLVGRWGGEEFMILCPGTNLDGAILLAEKLRLTIAQHDFEAIGRKTGSFGVTSFRPGEPTDAMIKRADDALYRAKKNGRNRIEAV